MRKLFAAAIVAAALLGVAALFASPVQAAKGTCANVRCAACPDGYHLLLKWPNCCECVRN